MGTRANIAHYAGRAELFMLYTLALILPTVESLKSLTAFLYLVFWLIHHAAQPATGTRTGLDRFEWILLAILAWTVIGTANSVYFDSLQMKTETKGLRDTMLWLIPMWLIYRSNYPAAVINRVANLLLAGVIIGLGVGVWDLYHSYKADLEFHSAGIVTQSAIYLGIGVILALGKLGKNQQHGLSKSGLIWWGLFMILLAGLIAMGSRGAFLAVFVAGLVVATLQFQSRRLRRRLAIAASLLVISAIAVSALAPDNMKQRRSMADKLVHMLPGAEAPNSFPKREDPAISDKIRFENWRIAAAQITQGGAYRLITGMGPMKYPRISVSRLHFDPALQAWPFDLNHAHNLFLNKLVEEGVIGLALFLALLGYIGHALFNRTALEIPPQWLWVGAAGALIVPLVAGLFGSPWAREHAILSGILIAMFLSNRKRHLQEPPSKP